MNKKIIYYLVCWLGMVILFNLICFVTPINLFGVNKYDDGFWIEYFFVIVAFFVHLLFVCVLLNKTLENYKVQNMQLIIISNIEMLIMVIVGISCMLIPSIPSWVGIIGCYSVLFFSIGYIVVSNIVLEKNIYANKVINDKTIMYRSLVNDAQALVSKSTTTEIRMLTQKVFDSIRYSDSISSDELIQDEIKIQEAINNLTLCIENCDVIDINKQVDFLLALIELRNNKCKLLKRKM